MWGADFLGLTALTGLLLFEFLGGIHAVLIVQGFQTELPGRDMDLVDVLGRHIRMDDDIHRLPLIDMVLPVRRLINDR